MMFKKNMIFIFLLLIIFLSTGVMAEQEKESFVIGVENINYYPLYNTVEDDDSREEEYLGFARSILDKFSEIKGYDFIYQPLPVSRLTNLFVNGEVDFKFPDHKFWSSELKEGKDVVYSEGVIDYIDGVVVTKENKDMELDDFNVLGSMFGFTPFDYLDLIEKGEVKLSEAHNYEGLLRQVMSGRIDGFYSNIAVVNHHLEKMNIEDKIVFNPNLPHTDSHYHLSTIKYPELIKEFDQFLKEYETEIKEMKEEYGIE